MTTDQGHRIQDGPRAEHTVGPRDDDAVAVVGLACRLPGAPDLAAFWDLLRAGRDAVCDPPPDRWPGPVEAGGPPRRGGFLDHVDTFDAAFFDLSPAQAAAMDPQQRLTLELGWEALEHARLVPASLRGASCGVFIGATWNDYALLVDRAGPAAISRHTLTGLNRGVIANHLSYALGLRGPSMVIDSVQSSALVAVHAAVESVRRGESDLALAGGVNLNLTASGTTAAGQFGALSPDGRCFTFDERANGYVRGEGGGLVVLRPLRAALADGDTVYAVIRGSAVTNDGATEGLTVPGVDGQAAALRQAYQRAGLDPGQADYVELHGTGTAVGDPVEAAALGRVIGAARPAGAPLRVGSAKTNVGHLEGAAGIAGLLKVVLSIGYGQVPPSVDFQRPNPDIPLADLRLEMVTEARPWPEAARLAGVSSFGMGGTNCHLILGPPSVAPASVSTVDGTDLPLVLSARSHAALRAQAARLRERLARGPDAPGGAQAEPGFGGAEHPQRHAGVALSLLRSRAEFEHRAVILGGAPALGAFADGEPDEAVIAGTVAGGRCVFA